jgi:hypothetical protein
MPAFMTGLCLLPALSDGSGVPKKWWLCVLPVLALGLAASSSASGAAGQQKPGPAVVAYLDGLYEATAAEHPDPTQPKSRGLVKIKPLGKTRIRHGFSDVISQLPDGQPGVAEAKDIGELLWPAWTCPRSR